MLGRYACSFLWCFIVVSFCGISGQAKDVWRTGTIQYVKSNSGSFLDSIPESDRYYVGNDICAGGDEHNAPVCMSWAAWSRKKVPDSFVIHMEDGTVITVKADYVCIGAPQDVFADMVLWWGYAFSERGESVPAKASFRYRLGAFHKKGWLQDVTVELLSHPDHTPRFESGSYFPNGMNVLSLNSPQ